MQCFTLVIVTIPFFRSMSLIFSHVSSIGLVYSSFYMDSISAMRVVACDISMLSRSVAGIFGSLSYFL